MDVMDLTPDVQKKSNPITLASLQRKTQLSGKVIKTTVAGAIVDIGLDTPGVVHISQLQREPVNRVEDVVQVGQGVEVWVRRVFPKKNRIELTMIEPLKLEWREITPGMVVKGKVVRLEKYGAFVDIGAERPGLIHISEMSHDYIKDPAEVVKEGEEIEVKIIKVSRRKKQIKLSRKALMDTAVEQEKASVGVEKPVAKPRETSAEASGASEANIETVSEAEYVPTAMEMALRKAMERSQNQVDALQRQKTKRSKKELDDLLAHTLETRPKK